jgi:carbohydrate kinase (thermoresistant glucokinase family)
MTAQVVLVMGPTASGKSMLGAALAQSLGWKFLDGDDLHPPENVAKMAAGIPLTDADRGPWLARVSDGIDAWLREGQSGVIACSALRRAYRDRLRRPGLLIVEAWAPPEVLRARILQRPGHFMPASLLDSQLATLEAPAPDESIPRIDTTQPLSQSVETIRALLDR